MLCKPYWLVRRQAFVYCCLILLSGAIGACTSSALPTLTDEKDESSSTLPQPKATTRSEIATDNPDREADTPTVQAPATFTAVPTQNVSTATNSPTVTNSPEAEPSRTISPTAAAEGATPTIEISTATSPTLSVVPSATPYTATAGFLNGFREEDFIVIPPEVADHIREIFSRGQGLGRDPRAFSRLGASIVATHHFLGRFDYGPYELGAYSYLQPAIDHYAGSFERVGLAALRGLTAAAVFSPTWASREDCQANETVIDCELRIHNPSVIIIVLGTNDKWDAAEFEKYLRDLVQLVIDKGVIPVLATKADRFEGEDDRNNQIIRRVARELRVPLWDFDLLASTLPARGMGADNVHLTLFDYYDYNMPVAYKTGYGVYNLSALMMLQAILEETSQLER